MDIFEFELRYKAYAGLNRFCKLSRDEKTLIEMVSLTSKGIPDKVLQEISPEELKTLTRATYTRFKKDFLEENNEFSDSFTKDEYYYPLSDYIERLEYELKVVKEMGFNTYMLVVSDFTMWAKKNSIMVGPGRWSGAGSLLAFLISITDVNPFAYDLLFERFLNPARISMPDFDIDFEDTLRGKVVEYVTNKYGHDHVSAIGTYMKMATKAAFKDAARAIGIPFEKSNLISNLMGEVKSLKQVINKESDVNEELLTFYDQDQYIRESIVQGSELEGNLRQLWVHACGIIISPDPVTAHTATQLIDKGGEKTLVSQFDGPTLEYIGLLKMDFLGLRNLSVIKNCIKILRAKYKDISEQDITTQSEKNYFEDKELFNEFIQTMSFNPELNSNEVFEKVFMTGDTTGIFQFEWDGIRRFLIDLKPNHINDLVAMNALYRPGPLEFIPTYIKRKHWEEPVDYMLPELRDILLSTYNDPELIESEKLKLEQDLGPIMGLTYGIAVYQEQLMFLVQSMAGFSLPEADLLRRWVGKKKKEIIEQLKLEFMERGQSFRWYKPETAKFIYEKMIEPAASYSFNKSHAVCYAHIAYQTGYLKARYPLEFYAALLRSVEEDTDKLAGFIDEILDHNITIETPHINRAYNHIAASHDTIIMWFYACKGIGFEIGEQIEQERKTNGDFSTLANFLERCPFVANKRVMESLIKAGSFDERYDRNTLLINLPTLLEWHKNAAQLDMGLFGGMAETQELVFQETSTTSIIEKCKYDVEIFKNMISWHPLDGLYPYIKKFGFIEQYKKISDPTPFSCAVMIKKITRARKKWFFVMVEDVTDSFEFFIKDILDLKLYDILIINGFKSRNRGIDTMIKVQIEQFIDQAKKANKYNPQRTVAKVRAERKGILTPNRQPLTLESEEINEVIKEEEEKELFWPSDSTDISIDVPDTEIIAMEEGNIEGNTEQILWPITISLPDSIDKIKLLSNIINSSPGEDYSIIVHGTTYHISQQGMDLIQKIIG